MSQLQPNGGLKSGSPKFRHNQQQLNEEPCPTHRNKTFQLFCDTCKQLVCTNCIVESHSQHSFQGIQEIAIAGRKRLQQLMKTVKEKYSAEIDSQLRKLESIKRDAIIQTDRIIEQFKSRQAELVQEAEVATLKQISAVQVRRQNTKQEIQAVQKKVSEKKSSCETLLSMCAYLVEEGSDVAVIRSRESIDNLVKPLENKVEFPEFKLPKISFADFEAEAIENLLGNFEIGNRSIENAEKTVQSTHEGHSDSDDIRISVERVYSFECQGKGGVLAVQPISGDTALVTCYDSANKIHPTGASTEEMKYSLSFPINDLAVLRSGDILVSSYHSRCIRKLQADDKMETFISTSMLLPLGIHVTKSEDIFVCLVDELSYTITPNSRRQVSKYSSKGATLNTFEYNGYRRLFTLPGSISENTNGDICVVDLLSENAGGLLILDKEGYQKHTYSGIKGSSSFRPHSVCNDAYSHIIVSDLSTDSVHLLNEKGEFLMVLLGSAEGLFRPSAINIDINGYLWVGHAKRSDSDAAVIVEEPVIQVYKYTS